MDAAITASSYVLGCIVDKEKNFKTSELISQIGASVISSCLADCEFSDAKTIDRKMKQSKAVITRGTNKKMMKKANYMIKNCHKDIKKGDLLGRTFSCNCIYISMAYHNIQPCA